MINRITMGLALLGLLGASKASAQTTARDTSAKTIVTKLITPPVVGTGNVYNVIAGTSGYNNVAAAIKLAGLDATLAASGPYTVFAPNDAGFAKAPKPQIDSLMKNPATLATLLKAHVVAGKYTKAAINTALKKGNGQMILKTLNGDNIVLSINDKRNLQLTDAAGNTALVTGFDMPATNGVVHGINTPLVKL